MELNFFTMIKYLSVFIGIIVFMSCKYEDGPLISFTPIPNRIAGDYSLESVTVNGTDVTSDMDTLHISYFHFDTDKPPIGGEGGFSVSLTDSTGVYGSSWTLDYTSKKTKIYLDIFGCNTAQNEPVAFAPLPGYLSDGTCGNVLWDIIKLTNTCLWLRIDFSGSTYEVHLKEN